MHGYYRTPTIHGERVVFACEDDLWEVPVAGGMARRLTTTRGSASYPQLSPDGVHLAFNATDDGPTEVYVMPSRGGRARRLTFLGAGSRVVGWTDDGQHVLFSTLWRDPFERRQSLWRVPVGGGEPQPMGVGESVWWDSEPGGKGRVLGRYSVDLAWWKRYKGGTAAQIWCDVGDGTGWQRLFAKRRGGFAVPMWIGERLWFISDFEGHGNLYSSTPTGEDLRRHTHHSGFYVRGPSSDGSSIVYSIAGELRSYDVTSGEDRAIPVEWASPKAQLQRTFAHAEHDLDEFALHPEGHSIGVIARGKPFTFGLWEGAVRQSGEEQGVRYRLMRYFEDGARVLVVSDAAGGAERLEIHRVDGSAPPVVVSLDGGDSLGRVVRLELSPGQDAAALTNHRNEIVHVDLERGRARVLDRSRKARPEGIAWSRGGRWLAYSIARTRLTSVLMLADTQTWERHQVTEGSFRDVEPAFDPQGRYLYFLSMRTFNPTYGEAFFELNFNHMWTPCLVTLREDIESPFLDKPRALEDDEDEEDGKRDEQGCRDDVSSQDAAVHTALAEEDPGEGDEEVEEFDVEGIRRRVLALPVPARDYAQLGATKDRVFYIAQPVRGALSAGEPARVLRFFDLKKKRERRFSVGVDAFDLSADGKTIAMSSDDGLRVVSATGAGPEEDADDAPSRETGWLDLGRVACAVEPREEWRQMLREVWRLMRDQFWREDMSGVDWDAIWTRYSRLLERVATRSELSDVIWTMQGELGTSHAYEMGGDYRRRPPSYDVGQLGADVAWDPDWTHPQASTRGGYRITHIVRGDDWSTTDASPLTRPGLDIAEGDVLVAINGRALGEAHSVQQRLVNQAGREVELMLWREGEEEPRRRTVKTLASERALRYREWVEQRRDIAHERGGGRVGYVHIPDMGARGYAEFHRSYMAESHHDALVVDVRCNGGGHVSQLILERLARSVLGYDIPRWEDPVSYPAEGPRGPLVALTNAHAGSDGDIFSHCFKLLKLGPLMGERTWGGVIGIWPRHSLVDGTVTTQPEFSFWFVDVGFGVENYGTDPDIEVPMPPEAWAADEDVQLHQAIDKALESLQAYSPGFPDFGPAPVLAAPPLPEPPSE